MRIMASLIFGLFVCVSVGIPGAHAQSAQWTLIETTGPVFVAQPLIAPRAVSLQEKLAPGSTLTTGGTGRAVVVRGAQNITIGPNSRIALPAAAANGMTRIVQEFGAAMFKIDKRGVQHFEVDTPMIAAVVKGTTFTVSVAADGHFVHVLEGLVEVSMRSGGPAVPVPAGVTAAVFHNNPAVIELRDATTAPRAPVTDVPSDGTSERTANGAGTGVVASLSIPQTIGAGPLDFAGLTNGLVKSTGASGGAVNPTAGSVGSSNAGGSVKAGGSANAAGGNANSNAGGNANSNAGGNANSNAGGNANSNAGGNANSNAGGNANSNAGGNANSNAGGNANSNAGGNANALNAGGNANSNAGGNANSNAGGNGNGGLAAIMAGNGNANGKKP